MDGPDGELITFKVPDESQNLIRSDLAPNSRCAIWKQWQSAWWKAAESSAEAVDVVEMFQGRQPGRRLARITQITGTVEEIDHHQRNLSVRGPAGELRRFTVSEEWRISITQVGDTVGLRH